MCLYVGTHSGATILGIVRKVGVSVTFTVWLASPVTCQSVTVHDGVHPRFRLSSLGS